MPKKATNNLFTGVLTFNELIAELISRQLEYGFDTVKKVPICKNCKEPVKERRVGFPAGSGKYLRASVSFCSNCDEEPHYLGANIDLPDNDYGEKAIKKAS